LTRLKRFDGALHTGLHGSPLSPHLHEESYPFSLENDPTRLI
jgi:hypothetical protein